MNKKRATIISAFSWIGYLTIVTFGCQLLIFLNDWDWPGLGLSLLFGTAGTMTGAFAAFLASPYDTEDEKRITRVSTVLGTLVTGYLLAKVIDPLLLSAMKDPAFVFDLMRNGKNAANTLIALVSFIGGFLGTYQFRAYLSATFFLRGEKDSETERDEAPPK